MEKLGTPHAVLRLMRDQYANFQRRFKVNGMLGEPVTVKTRGQLMGEVQ